MRREIDPGHEETQGCLRTIGPVMVVVGLILTAIGLVSFFSAFGSFSPPRYFRCALIGLPMTGIGLSICKFGFMGAVTRYVAGEVAPVGKDTINYMADGTKEAVRDVAATVADGIRSGATAEAAACPKCNAENDPDARFCKNCGAPLATQRNCPNCGHPNAADARFCDNCGRSLP
jgi:hypothetical protein